MTIAFASLRGGNLSQTRQSKKSAFYFGKGGMGVHIQDGGYIFLPISLETNLNKEVNLITETLARNTNAYKTATAENQRKLLSEIATKKNSLISTQNPKHAVIHETAHTFQPTSLEAEVRELTEDELKIAGEISIYAKICLMEKKQCLKCLLN